MHVEAQEPPWRVVRAFAQESGAALVHLHNVSGGVLAGDHLHLKIGLGAASSALITTTGATRLYRHREGAAIAQQHVEIQLEAGALLEYLPDPIIPFAGSRYAQRTSVSLAGGATLLWWETLAPGRQAMGETFAFDSLRFDTEVRSTHGPLLIEKFLLEPRLRPLQSAARLGLYSHASNFYAFRAGAPPSTWLELEARLNEFCSARSSLGGTIWGSSALAADGIAVRGLSISAREIPAALAGIWKIARRFLTGEEAVLPRKVY